MKGSKGDEFAYVSLVRIFGCGTDKGLRTTVNQEAIFQAASRKFC